MSVCVCVCVPHWDLHSCSCPRSPFTPGDSDDHLPPAPKRGSPFSVGQNLFAHFFPPAQGETRLDEGAKPKGSVAYLPERQGHTHRRKRLDGPAWIWIERPTRTSRTQASIADVHWIQDLEYAATPLTTHLRPHLRGTSWLAPVHGAQASSSDPRSRSRSRSRSEFQATSSGPEHMGSSTSVSCPCRPRTCFQPHSRPAAVCAPASLPAAPQSRLVTFLSILKTQCRFDILWPIVTPLSLRPEKTRPA